MLYVLA